MIIRSGISRSSNLEQTPKHIFFIDDDAPSSLGGSTNQEIFWLGHDNDVEPFHEYFWWGQLGRCAGALGTGFDDLGSSLHYVRAWPVSVSFFLRVRAFLVFPFFCMPTWNAIELTILPHLIAFLFSRSGPVRLRRRRLLLLLLRPLSQSHMPLSQTTLSYTHTETQTQSHCTLVGQSWHLLLLRGRP